MSWPSAKGDIRLNNAYGQLLLRRGLFARAEGYFRTAIQRLTWKNPNPYDSEPYYNLGLALWYQGKEDEAYDAFFKATWTAAQQEMSFYYLAAIACRRGEWDLALAHVERSLVKNGRNLKAIALKGLILAKQNRPEEARKWLASQLEQDPFDYVSRFLLEELEDCGHQQLLQLMGSRVSSFVEGAIDLLDGGFARLAGRYLDLCPGSSPMLYYYRALCAWRSGEEEKAGQQMELAAQADPYCCFPNRLEDQRVLEWAMEQRPEDGRVLLELDQLYKKLGMAPQQRLEHLEQYPQTFPKRDDLFVEYITLLNLVGRYAQAHELTMGRKFHPWEGGEGKITKQYAVSLTRMALEELKQGRPEQASQLLRQALVFPENLGEGKLEGAKDNDIYYALGVASRQLGQEEQARAFFQKASVGTGEPAGMMYYYDQPADMILCQGLAHRALGEEQAARARFHKLVDYGEAHLFDVVSFDYFAVSLPDLLLFQEDLTVRNQGHCHFLIGLGCLGLGELDRARESFRRTLEIDPSHQGALLQLRHMEG